jgi:hypothetical protein
MFQGIKVGDSEYASAMLEAKIEFDQRLAKLDARKAGLFED